MPRNTAKLVLVLRKLNSETWRAVCAKFKYKIHRNDMIYDYSQFLPYIYKFQKMISIKKYL